MIRFLLRRIVTMAVTLLIISALVFFIIKLPPGDFLSNQIAELRAQGESASIAKAEFLIKQYGLDKPAWQQYLVWIGVMPGPNGFSGLLQGDWVIETIGGKAIVPESKPSMTFGPEGKLSGNASCNRYFGPYELTGEGIKIANLATSMMMCDEKTMEQERLLLKSLQSTTRFEVDQAGKLILIGDDGAAVVGRRK